MTVSTTNARYSYAANGSQTAFSFPRFAQAAADFVVTVTSSTGVEDLQVLTTDYTVTGAGTSWTITFGTAPASGSTVVIFRDPSLVQETDFESEGDPLAAMNTAVDRVYSALQAIKDEAVSRSPGAPTGFDATLPNPLGGGGYALGLNASEDALEWLTELTGATVSAAMESGITAGSTGEAAREWSFSYRMTNIAALRAATWASADAPLFVALEYNWNTGDGGGSYYYDTTDTSSTDDGGLVILTSTSGTALRYKRRHNGTIPADAFGVSPSSTAANNVTRWAAMMASATVKTGLTITFNGTYSFDAAITLGDGSSPSVPSTANAIRLVGVGGPSSGEHEFSGTKRGARFLYSGSSTDSGFLLNIAGPIYGVEVENIALDCAGLIGGGLEVISAVRSTFREAVVTRYRTLGMSLKTTTPSAVGSMGGFATCLFEGINIEDPTRSGAVYASANGLFIQGSAGNNVGFARNTFRRLQVSEGGASGAYGIKMLFADNNVFDNVYTYPSSGSSSKGLILTRNGSGTLPGSFPLENCFSHAVFVGGIDIQNEDGSSATDIGQNLILGYSVSDGAPLPTKEDIKWLTHAGRMGNFWHGSEYTIQGRSDPGTALTTGRRYLAASGVTTANAADVFQHVIGAACLVRGFIVRLDSTPGVGNTRVFTVFKNGVATALTLTYGAAVSGVQTVEVVGGVTFARGDTISIDSNVTGTPTNTNASWGITVYPTEAV